MFFCVLCLSRRQTWPSKCLVCNRVSRLLVVSLWIMIDEHVSPSKPEVVALCYYTTPGRSSPQSWGVSGVELYNYSNWVCHFIVPVVGIAHMPTPICRRIHDWLESQSNDPFMSETLHVALIVCAWDHPRYYVTWPEANHTPRGQFHWLTLKEEFYTSDHIQLSVQAGIGRNIA